MIGLWNNYQMLKFVVECTHYRQTLENLKIYDIN